jgi:hypothetical protein
MKKLLLAAFAFSAGMLSAQTTQTFNYTGSMQTFTVPVCVTTVTITCYGAQGDTQSVYPQGLSGFGGMSTGELAVTSGQVLNIFVGGRNGYNGGGTGGANGNTFSGGPQTGFAPSGGGASDVRVNGTAVGDRVIVAGGGGGAGVNGTWSGCQVAGPAGNGGAGGGSIGSNGTFGVGNPCNCYGGGGAGGLGGTQSAGGIHGNYNGNTSCLRSTWGAGQDGTLYQGGAGSTAYHNGGGGGGGGYYGGGSGGSGSDTTPGGGGGGGSSWTGTLTSASTSAGVRAGNGMVVISYSISGAVPSAPSQFNISSSCPNDTVFMSIDTVATATSYTWTLPVGYTLISGQGTNSIYFVTSSSSDVISVYATNSCGNGPAAMSNVILAPASTVSLGADTAGCYQILLTADSSTTYQWCSGETTQQIVASSSGAYCVQVTNSFGCEARDTVNVTIYPAPTVSATASMNFVCIADDTVQLSGSPTGGTFSGPGVIPGDEFDPVAAGVGTHNVVYTYTDGNGCAASDTLAITVDVCTGIALNTDLNFAIIPNPATTQCKVIFGNDMNDVQINITDIQGRTIKALSPNSVKADAPVYLDLHDIAPGTYLIQVNTVNSQSVQKLQIQ